MLAILIFKLILFFSREPNTRLENKTHRCEFRNLTEKCGKRVWRRQRQRPATESTIWAEKVRAREIFCRAWERVAVIATTTSRRPWRTPLLASSRATRVLLPPGASAAELSRNRKGFAEVCDSSVSKRCRWASLIEIHLSVKRFVSARRNKDYFFFSFLFL